MDSLLDDIDAITEKLKTHMTPGQRHDWQILLDKRLAKLKNLSKTSPEKPKRTRQ
jgi:hypothetical protein